MKSEFIIAVADDDEDEHLFLKEAVAECNHCIVLQNFISGDQLIKWLYNAIVLPDLIILDINMPLLGGFETLQQIRTMDNCADTPIVMYSTSMNPLDVNKAYRYGANLYVSKSLASNNLASVITKIIDGTINGNLHLLKNAFVPSI